MIRVLIGDALEQLRTLPDESVHCVVTSPPYYSLRDYSRCGCGMKTVGSGHITEHSGEGNGNARIVIDAPNPSCPICHGTGIIDGVKEHQLGLEKTPEEYITKMVETFREVKRVLRDDGSLWLNMGDNFDNKQLVGMPWRLAFALQADGWWLRSDIIWAKPNPMPESVRDRPTKSHEYIFLLTKNVRYFYDQEAVREPFNYPERRYNADTSNHKTRALADQGNRSTAGLHDGRTQYGNPQVGRNLRSVWEISTQPYSEAHFATFAPELPRRCIKAGTSERGCCAKCGAPWERIIEKEYLNPKTRKQSAQGDWIGTSKSKKPGNINSGDYPTGLIPKTLGWHPTCQCNAEVVPCVVLDPFAGSGTTGFVARSLGRKAILIELNSQYGKLIERRAMSNIPDICEIGT